MLINIAPKKSLPYVKALVNFMSKAAVIQGAPGDSCVTHLRDLELYPKARKHDMLSIPGATCTAVGLGRIHKNTLKVNGGYATAGRPSLSDDNFLPVALVFNEDHDNPGYVAVCVKGEYNTLLNGDKE